MEDMNTDDTVQLLIDLSFDADLARRAVYAMNGKLEAAIDFIEDVQVGFVCV
jgi:hypothetical protein